MFHVHGYSACIVFLVDTRDNQVVPYMIEASCEYQAIILNASHTDLGAL